MALGVMAALVALGSSAAPGRVLPTRYVARADTDSVRVDLPERLAGDTLRGDTLQGDSMAVQPDTGLARKYLPRLHPDRPAARLFPRRRPPLSLALSRSWKHEVQLDSTARRYLIYERVAGQDVRYPVAVDLATYRRERLRYDLSR
ncbi:MAG: hypothetical protein D6790_01850, partial [Caldilineae bacterium]